MAENDEDYWNSADYIGCYLLEKIHAARDDLLNELNKKSSCIHVLNLKTKCNIMSDEVEAYMNRQSIPSYVSKECFCDAIQIQTSSSNLDAQVILDIDQSEFEFDPSKNSNAEKNPEMKMKIFSCNQCRLHFSSDKMLHSHLESSAHLERIAKINLNKTEIAGKHRLSIENQIQQTKVNRVVKYEESNKRIISSLTSKKPSKRIIHDKRNLIKHKMGVFECTACNLTFNSALQMNDHLNGSKHVKVFDKENEKKETADPDGWDETLVVNVENKKPPIKSYTYKCVICNITLLNREKTINMHLNGKRHMKNLRLRISAPDAKISSQCEHSKDSSKSHNQQAKQESPKIQIKPTSKNSHMILEDSSGLNKNDETFNKKTAVVSSTSHENANNSIKKHQTAQTSPKIQIKPTSENSPIIIEDSPRIVKSKRPQDSISNMETTDADLKSPTTTTDENSAEKRSFLEMFQLQMITPNTIRTKSGQRVWESTNTVNENSKNATNSRFNLIKLITSTHQF